MEFTKSNRIILKQKPAPFFFVKYLNFPEKCDMIRDNDFTKNITDAKAASGKVGFNEKYGKNHG
ncbi:MAG: hypothetical protein U0L92_00495 [Clostridia bacterium]|nr:hypothetical protein [Clostridia bacterium]